MVGRKQAVVLLLLLSACGGAEEGGWDTPLAAYEFATKACRDRDLERIWLFTAPSKRNEGKDEYVARVDADSATKGFLDTFGETKAQGEPVVEGDRATLQIESEALKGEVVLIKEAGRWWVQDITLGKK